MFSIYFYISLFSVHWQNEIRERGRNPGIFFKSKESRTNFKSKNKKGLYTSFDISPQCFFVTQKCHYKLPTTVICYIKLIL